ncbi:MAG: aminotransferase class I/II-fold pyridoxal phosphate-dependent enzyme [Chloroflexota bacterium]
MILEPKMTIKPQTLVDVLKQQVANKPDHRVYTFLENGETESAHLTFAELDYQVKRVAAQLQKRQAMGERVLLLYPAGLDFIVAFLGCLYTGAVAVPVYSPNLKRSSDRVERIAHDAQAKFVLTTTSTLTKIQQQDIFPALNVLATDQCDSSLMAEWPDITPEANTLAFIQYTSGSTGSPKGVMISHGNLLHNLAAIRQAFWQGPRNVGVFWLPMYHDMGLIGGVLAPIYVGGSAIFMSPAAFGEKPMRWLKAISKYQATISTAPNFAYQLCVDQMTPEQCVGLDLHSWQTAFCGAELIRAETLKRFSNTFAPYGFRSETFHPCYGLAESTLIVSGETNQPEPTQYICKQTALRTSDVVASAMGDEDSRIYIGCGRAIADQKVVIVDPISLSVCPPEKIGEVWVQGNSVAQGYWQKPSETKHTFQAQITATDSRDDGVSLGSYLRTGDLGFLHEDELFITGRLKEIVIIRGLNYYPQDFEQALESSHPALRANCGAAFSVEVAGTEQLVIIFEVERTYRRVRVEDVATIARQIISETFGLELYAFVLIKTGHMPKTTSGKVQRYLCRRRYIDSTLPEIGRSTIGNRITDKAEGTDTAILLGEAKDVEALLITQIAQVAGISQSLILPQKPLNALGFDSLKTSQLKAILENKYALQISLDQWHQGLTLRDLIAQLDPDTKHQIETLTQPQNETKQSSSASSQSSGHVFDKIYAFDQAEQLDRLGIQVPYYREFTQNEGPTAIFEGRRILMFGSNNYLGLTVDERVRQATAETTLTDGPSMTGSRLLNGSTTQHQQLEKKLADFLGREDALVFTTGYQANIGLLSAVMTSGTTLLVDELCHASVYDGAAVGHCTIVQFKHNDLADLEQKLIQTANNTPTMVMVDGVYSMEGDIACLPDIKALCERFEVPLAVDDAHGLGTLGKTGQGSEVHFEMLGAADILSGTFSKSLASVGGWVAADRKITDWIRFKGRSMLFSAATPPPALAAASTALDILIQEPWRVQKLNDNAAYWRFGLRKLGFDTGQSQTAIVPVIIGDDLQCLQFNQALLEAGVYVNAALHPAVPQGSALLRTSVMATHEQVHLEQALAIFADVGAQLKVI